MNPPIDFDAIAAGASTLRTIGATMRLEAERSPERPELWLTVRDCEGLAERLLALEPDDWEGSFAYVALSGQDIGVLDELLQSSASGRGVLPQQQALAVKRLRDQLSKYFGVDKNEGGR